MSRQQQRTDEFGFSLVELMVVVLIIGVLVAIAVPKFTNTQRGARAKTAQANVRAAEVVLSSVYIDKAGFAPIDLAALTAADAVLFPSTATVGTPSNGPGYISWAYVRAGVPSIEPTLADGFVLAARSTSGTCYMMRVDVSSHAFGQRPAPAPADCVATLDPVVNTASNRAWDADSSVQWS